MLCCSATRRVLPVVVWPANLTTLAAVANGYAPAPRSRLLLVDASSEHLTPPVELMTLPAEVLASSYTWGPDGNWVAFLTQASTGSGGNSFVALCAVDTTAGGAVAGFRYVADLGHSSDPAGPMPVAPVAWSPRRDGRLAYAAAAPKITVTNPLGLPTTSGGEPDCSWQHLLARSQRQGGSAPGTRHRPDRVCVGIRGRTRRGRFDRTGALG